MNDTSAASGHRALSQDVPVLSSRRPARSHLLALVAALATPVVVLAGISPASATVAAPGGPYYGNQCQAADFKTVHYGADAGNFINAKSPNNWMSVSACAYDTVRDSASAENFTEVWQYRPNVGWTSHPHLRAVASKGVYHSAVAAPQYIYRQQGATHVGFRTWACQYDGSRGVRLGCTQTWTLKPWA